MIGQGAADVVLVGVAGRGVGELLVVAHEPSETEESERVLTAAATSLLGRDEQVHVGRRAIEHPVHEHDLGAEEVLIATEAGLPLAVEVDAHDRARRVARSGLP